MTGEDRQQTTDWCVGLNLTPPSGNIVQQSELKMYGYKEPVKGALKISITKLQ